MTPPPYRLVIPSRYASSRLPGKPLALLAGKPMVVRVLECARLCGAEDVVVAADDARIIDAVESAGGRALMTSPDHPSGTDRLAEVVDLEGLDDETILVNLQGDEPLMPAEILDQLAGALAAHPEAGIATMATPIHVASDLFDPNVVKVVLEDGGMARYFSRAPIPWVRDLFKVGSNVGLTLPAGVPFLRHLGLYAYRARTLRRLVKEAPAAIEEAERLEQLRALALGIPIHVTLLEEAPGHGVDTPEDLARVARLFAAEGGR